MSETIAYGNDVIGGQSSNSRVAGYQPTTEEERTIKLVDQLYHKAKIARKPYDDKWLQYYRMFRGRQWKDQRPSYRHSEVVNLIFRAIQADVPVLMDSRPTIEFTPQEPGDFELSQVLNDLLESDWQAGNWLYKLTEAVYDAHFYGTGLASLKYDPDASNGLGRIIFQSEDVFCAFPDGNARDVNDKANFFVYAEPTSVDLLKREFPQVQQYIKSDLIDIAKRERAELSAEEVSYKAPSDGKRGLSTTDTQSRNLDSKDDALRIACFIHDPEYCEDEVTDVDPQTGEPKVSYIQRLKYPNGRHIVTAGGVLCKDEPLEYEDKKFPYLRVTNYILPREFWGISEVEQLESPQIVFNKLVCFALDTLTIMGNPIWIVDKDSGVDTDNLFNRPGMIVEPNAGTRVERVEGVQLQPYVLQMIDRMKSWFDDVSGSSDVSRGIRPEGVTAASAITALQEAQQVRLRQKSRNIDAFLNDFGKMYASRVFQFYSAPRVFRVTNDQNVSRYFKFHMDTVQTPDPATGQMTEQKVARIRNFELGDDGQHHLSDEKTLQLRGEFDVRVQSGSSLPFEKNRIEQQSLALFDRNIIDAEEVMKNIKYPNYQAVLQRLAEKAAMQAQQDAQSAAMKQAPSAPTAGAPAA